MYRTLFELLHSSQAIYYNARVFPSSSEGSLVAFFLSVHLFALLQISNFLKHLIESPVTNIFGTLIAVIMAYNADSHHSLVSQAISPAPFSATSAAGIT